MSVSTVVVRNGKMSDVVYHPGTKTFMSMDECVIVNVPDHIEDVEMYLEDLVFGETNE